MREQPLSDGALLEPRVTPARSLNRRGLSSVAKSIVASVKLVEPLARREGTRAEYAWYSAHWAQQGTLNQQEQIGLCNAFARWLWAYGFELDYAVNLAAHSLVLQDDPELRKELGQWLLALGQTTQAGVVLRPLCSDSDLNSKEYGVQAVRYRFLLAEAWARAGEASKAVQMLSGVLNLDPQNIEACVQLGTLATWAPEVVSPERAALSFLKAAERKEANRDRKGAFEERLRAFVMDPGCKEVAQSLVEALSARGRMGAAGEALRTHARALGDESKELICQCIREALGEGDLAYVLGLCLEAEPKTQEELMGLALRIAGLQAAPLREVLVAYREMQGERLQGAARAEALAQLAQAKPAPLRAVLLSAAAQTWAHEGEREKARTVAETACYTDPTSAWAVGALAGAAVGYRDRAAAAALEHALGILVPSAGLYEELAAIFETLEEPALAFAWTQRWLSLRPGCPRAMRALLGRAAALAQAPRLNEALGMALSQPMPLVVDAWSEALRTLTQLDPSAAALCARRTLEHYGPGDPEVQHRLLEAAVAAKDWHLAALMEERALAAQAIIDEGARDRDKGAWAEALLRIADLRHNEGDSFGERHALGRALAAVEEPQSLAPRLSRCLQVMSPDAELLELELRSRLQQRNPEANSGSGQSDALLWRYLGGARWDLAHDRAGALVAWQHAAELDAERGVVVLGRDLMDFAGPGEGLQEMIALAERQPDRTTQATMLNTTACLALEASLPVLAYQAARRAVLVDPTLTEALATVEKSAEQASQPAELSELYTVVADASKGCFGRRAAHYRGARQFELRGQPALAMQHAIDAFEAVPGLSMTYVLLTRLADHGGDCEPAVRSLERVAAAAQAPEEQAFWLRRAAMLAGNSEGGVRLRLDLLLRALRIRTDVQTVQEVASALRETIERGGEEPAVAELRFERAQRAALTQLAGPYGAHIALAFVQQAFALFPDSHLALDALERALLADADSDQFASLLPDAGRLAMLDATSAPNGSYLVRCQSLAESPYGGRLGPAAMRLASAIALAQKEEALAVHWLLEAAHKAPEDPAIRADAQALLHRLEDGPLRSRLQGALLAPPRAEAPLELAEESEKAEDLVGALNSLVDVASRARELGDTARLTNALLRQAALTDGTVRASVLCELAVLEEASGDVDSAVEHWKQVAELDPANQDALTALERVSTDRGDYETLASVLAHRLALGGSAEEVHVLSLRRAALLEHRLGRLDEACAELEAQLERKPNDASVLRFLAALYERIGEPLRAAPLLLRAAHATAELHDRAELGARSAEIYLRAGDPFQARCVLEEMLAHGQTPRLLALRVDLERQAHNPRGLADALDEFAVASMDPAEQRAQILVEAARASLAAGDPIAALERAQRAARIAPQTSQAQLLARVLEYRARGAGTPQEATQTIEELRSLSGQLRSEEIPLHAFLLAEALDAVHGGAAGMRELSARHAEIGATPLIALGLAERLVRTSNFHAALPFFDTALAGELLGVRSRGHIALAAADAAFRIDDLSRVERYLEEATRDSVTAPLAEQRLANLRSSIRRAESSSAEDRRTLEELASRGVGLERARALAQLARVLGANPSEREAAEKLLSEAITVAAIDAQLRVELEAERDALQRTFDIAPGSSLPPASAAPDRRESPRPASARISLNPAESRIQQLRRKHIEAPGNAPMLLALRDAAEEDHHSAYAQALQHAIATFTPGMSLPLAPPLQAQREEPERVAALISRGAPGPVAEALALVWDGAPHLFRRDAGTYGITGLDRLSFGAVSLASRVYTAAARLLGTTRTTLFQRRSSGSVTASVALLVPPAVVLAGDLREETAELRFRLGAALVGASPEHALLFALPEANVRVLLAALLVAFGPDTHDTHRAKATAGVVSLAGSLWQALPARSQRRIRELCAKPEEFGFERATAGARQITYRAGLFVAGDLGLAATEVLREQHGQTDTQLPGSLQQLELVCKTYPALADLILLATSPEYADARWQASDKQSTRAPYTGGGTFRMGV